MCDFLIACLTGKSLSHLNELFSNQLMIDNVHQENTEESSEKEEPDFFEEHSNSDNVNNKIDQSPALSAKKVCAFRFWEVWFIDAAVFMENPLF